MLGLGWRHLMMVLAFWGLFVIYALRVNLNIALVSMVNHTAVGETGVQNVSNPDRCTQFSLLNSSKPEDGKFVWDENAQGLILASFYYGYALSNIPGGIAAAKWGGKWLFGAGILSTSLLTLLTPAAAQQGLGWFVATRVLMGAGEGVTFPAVQAIFGRWCPPLERSVLPGFCLSGTMVGTVVALGTGGFLSESAILGGWPSTFYIFGGLGVLWSVLWATLASSEPATSRWISEEERGFITKALASERSLIQGSGAIPWRGILTSLPFLAIVVSAAGDAWGFYTLLTELPAYLKTIMGFDLRTDGLLSALPYILRGIVMNVVAFLADWLRRTTGIRTGPLRKAFDFTGHFLAGLLLVGMLVVGYLGCAREAVVAVLVASVAVSGVTAAGFTVNFIDIAPRYAGLIYGISNTVCTATGFVSPQIVGALTNGNDTIASWRVVFLLTGGIYIFVSVFFVLFASGEVQPWAQSAEEEEEWGMEDAATQTRREAAAQTKLTATRRSKF